MPSGSPRPPGVGSRGPLKREPPTKPSGYRVSDQKRVELIAAYNFTETSTLQGVIDVAVEEMLQRLRRRPGFTEALRSAERERRRRERQASA
jgi:hypothetical protein